MKETKVKEDLKSMNVSELKAKRDVLRRERLNLVINAVTAHVKDYSQFRKLRKNIARVETYLRQKK